MTTPVSEHNITWRRYACPATPGDLGPIDLLTIWGLLRAEGLVDILFHDGGIRCLDAFLEFAASPRIWFYAAESNGVIIGLAYCTDFTSSGKACSLHTCTFKPGRDGSGLKAGEVLIRHLHDSGILTIAGMVPAPYRAAITFAKTLGFRPLTVLPQAIILHRERNGKPYTRLADLWVGLHRADK